MVKLMVSLGEKDRDLRKRKKTDHKLSLSSKEGLRIIEISDKDQQKLNYQLRIIELSHCLIQSFWISLTTHTIGRKWMKFLNY